MDSYETNVSFSLDVSGSLGVWTAVLLREERQGPSLQARKGGRRRTRLQRPSDRKPGLRGAGVTWSGGHDSDRGGRARRWRAEAAASSQPPPDARCLGPFLAAPP